MLKKILKKAVFLYRKHGMEMLLLEVFRNHRWPAALFVYARQEILLAPSEKLLPKRLLDNNYRVVEAGESDVKAIVGLMREEEDIPEEQLEYRCGRILDFVNSHNSLYIVYDGEEVVGGLYLYRRKREMQFSGFSVENRISVTGGDEIGFFGYGYVALQYRMKGIFPLLIDHSVRSNAAIKMYVSDISPLNIVSLNSSRRIGFSIIGNVRLFRFLTILPLWRVSLHDKTFYRFGKNLHITADLLAADQDYYANH